MPCKALEGPGRAWKSLGRPLKASEDPERPWKTLGTALKVFEGPGRQIKALEVPSSPSSSGIITHQSSQLTIKEWCQKKIGKSLFFCTEMQMEKSIPNFRERECKWKIPFPNLGTGIGGRNSRKWPRTVIPAHP